MPRSSPFVIALSCTEEQILVERSRQYTASYCKVVRAKIILFAASGMGNEQIARLLMYHARSLRSGGNGSITNGWMAWMTNRGADDRVLFPLRALWKSRLSRANFPSEWAALSRLSHADIACEAVLRGIVVSISVKTVWRYLHNDAIKPWMHRSWLFPRDPLFGEKAARVLDLYFRVFSAMSLGQMTT